MTICRQWAWKPDDQMKSLKECLQTLVKVVGGDGNLLFNVGPTAEGRIEPEQVQRLKEMGDWLARYGESVYGTRGGPFKPGPWGASTCKEDRIHLFVMNWPEEGPLELPPVPQTIVDREILTGGKLNVSQSEEGIVVDVPEADRQEIATVIRLTVDGNALDIPPVNVVCSGSLACQKPATASNVYQNAVHHYGPAMALDDDPATRWATDAGTHAAWLEVDLGQPTAVGRVMIDEAYEGRIQRFELQCREGDRWKTVLSGETVGRGFTRKFPAVTAQHFRLEILEATEGPTIWEFQLFGP